ncbi:unnamed protein product [Brassicogethes aeneus]|uniref:NR LBD domain-containing protein n=1 Tax=Brassicogethes aeneus TaxID=1431903 RepID=A0A9P0BAL4_BRAAE|nr:unnamed protein product [Brassicogethes aeneus]
MSLRSQQMPSVSSVQNERGPRNATLRKQVMETYYIEEKQPMFASNGNFSSVMQKTTLDLSCQMASSYVSSKISKDSVQNFGGNSLFCHPPQSNLASYHPSVVCEYAARLLFMNIQWAKTGPSFVTLNKRDQVILLQESWKELFIIGAAQLLVMINFADLLEYNNVLKKHVSPTHFLNTIAEFQLILENIRQLNLDTFEYTCLRAMALYKSNQNKAANNTLHDVLKVEAMRNECQVTLNKYIKNTYADNQYRCEKIILLLTTFSRIPSETIEELFFRSSIGFTSISRIIADLYKKIDLQTTFNT